MSFVELFLILFFFMPLTVLVIFTVIVIANRASRKNPPRNHYEVNYESMPHQTSPKPMVQKIGWVPWMIIGMALMVGLLFIFIMPIGMYREGESKHYSHNTSSPHSSTQVTYAKNKNIKINFPAYKTMMESDEALSSTKPPQSKPILVPVSSKNTSTPKTTDSKPAQNRSKAKSGAASESNNTSALIDSLLHAVEKSVQGKTPDEIEAHVEKFVAKNGEVGSSSDAKKLKKSFNNIKKVWKEEVPEDINREEAIETLVRILGRATATEAASRPPWVDDPSTVDSNGDYRTVITVGPYETRMECERHLDDELRVEVEKYVIHDCGPTAPSRIHLSSKQLRELTRRMYPEPLNLKIAPMFNLHVEMVFDAKAKALLREQIRASQAQEQITWSMTALGCVSLFLLGAFAVLKFDPLYQRRLAIAVGAGIVIVLGLSILAIV